MSRPEKKWFSGEKIGLDNWTLVSQNPDIPNVWLLECSACGYRIGSQPSTLKKSKTKCSVCSKLKKYKVGNVFGKWKIVKVIGDLKKDLMGDIMLEVSCTSCGDHTKEVKVFYLSEVHSPRNNPCRKCQGFQEMSARDVSKKLAKLGIKLSKSRILQLFQRNEELTDDLLLTLPWEVLKAKYMSKKHELPRCIVSGKREKHRRSVSQYDKWRNNTLEKQIKKARRSIQLQNSKKSWVIFEGAFEDNKHTIFFTREEALLFKEEYREKNSSTISQRQANVYKTFNKRVTTWKVMT